MIFCIQSMSLRNLLRLKSAIYSHMKPCLMLKDNSKHSLNPNDVFFGQGSYLEKHVVEYWEAFLWKYRCRPLDEQTVEVLNYEYFLSTSFNICFVF